ncbi:MAG: radical SAM protein [Planctomycetota bacterium]|jgi:uncharacterized protein
MTVEVRPLSVACNLQCQYCYQHAQRDAGNTHETYDIEKMKACIEKEGRVFTVFGGEPLMVPEKDLEELWSWGFEKYGRNGIQTNGTLINDNHVRMFKAYNVGVGISVDGPGELNDVRWAGTLERTRQATENTQAAIERLSKEGIPTSLIITLHRNNATSDKLPTMHEWLRHMVGLGVCSVRLHTLEIEDESIREKYGLSPEENLAAFLSLLELEEQLRRMRFDVFEDMRKMLRGQDANSTCTWNACDPYTTRSVRGIEGNGQSSNCGRTDKDGVDYVKCNVQGFERSITLYHTAQEHGGCKGCRFFLMCKGHCPGTGIDGDWRNRSEDCAVWKGLYRRIEERMLDRAEMPLSGQPVRKQVEQAMIDAWSKGENPTIAKILHELKQGPSAPASGGGNGHGDSPYADAHGDAHGDHTDVGGRSEEKGVGNLLPEKPEGCGAQKLADPPLPKKD